MVFAKLQKVESCINIEKNGLQKVNKITFRPSYFELYFQEPHCDEGKGRTLGFENTLPAFMIFLTGTAVAVTMLILENIYSWCKKNDKKSDGKTDFLKLQIMI